MTWNFFASGHGKGEHDGAGAVIKRTLTHEQLKPDAWPMKCASDVVSFLKQRFGGELGQVGVNRVFWEIKTDEVPRETQWNCKKVPGSRSLHCVNAYSSFSKHELRVKALSCYCEACMHEQWRRCNNAGHVQDWQYITLEPIADNEAECDEPDEEDEVDMPLYAGHHDALSDALCVGDNFATNAAEMEYDFYILRCHKPKYLATKAMNDSWGNCIAANTYVVEGHYYEKVEGTADIYYIPDNHPKVLLPSHLVRSIKFPMPPLPTDRNKYILSSEIYELVYNSMPLDM